MNLRELINAFRVLAKDTVKPYKWSDKELMPWFSEAEQEAAIRARLIRDSDEFPISAGDTSLDLPAGLFDIQYAELRGSDGTAYEIKPTDFVSLDALRPGWRSRSERPREYIHDELRLVLGAKSDLDYILYLEFFRAPKAPMSSDGDEPEIAEAHHIHLLDWVFYRGYSKPDADTLNSGKSVDGETLFARYFGKRPNANQRRRQNAGRPHRNRLH